MVLHLEFAFWSTWQMREQTWHICQAAHGLAKGRSSASFNPPRIPDFLRAIYGPSIATETPRRSLPIASNTIAAVRCRTWYESSWQHLQQAVGSRKNWRRDLWGKCENQRQLYAREDDRERAQRKKITAESTLANCQLNYAKPLEMTYF